MMTTMSNQLQPSRHTKGSLPASAIAALVMASILASLNTAYAQSQPSIEPIAQQAQALSAALTQTVDLQNSSVNSDVLKSDAPKSDAPKSDAYVDTLIKTATQKKLATHPTWLRLHYYTDTGNGDYQSKVDKPNFFVSPNGVTHPQDELEAFITKLVSQNRAGDIAAKDKVACRFPARTHWLTTQLGLKNISTNCPNFDAWMQKLDPQRLSVVFAEQYPDNPVSAFGHTLLLIDSSASLADPSAIDSAYALNDTVGGNEDDPFILYTAKSIVGSYPNDITIQPYPQQLSDYLQVDNRDVWTYELDLSQAEVQQIMRHVWETKDLQLPYYFTLDNCASEILRHIDVIRPEGNLLGAFKVAIVPSDVVRLLAKEGLISAQHYVPADATLAQAKRNNPALESLPNSSISSTNKLVPTHLNSADNNTLNAHARQRVMVGVGVEKDNDYLTLAYRGGFHDPLDSPSGYPQNFHLETGSLALRLYQDDNNDNNDSNNSNNNNNSTRSSNRNAAKHDRFELQDFTLIRGRSLHPINSARAGDSLLSSWGINVQATQVIDASQVTNTSHLVGNIAYEKGIAMAFGTPTQGTGELPPHLCYGLGTGMAQVGKGLNNGYRVGAGVNLGCRYLLNNRARLVGELQLPYWYHGEIGQTLDINKGTDNDTTSQLNKRYANYWQPTLTLGAQYDIDKNQAISLKGSYQFQDRVQNDTDVQLSYIKYF